MESITVNLIPGESELFPEESKPIEIKIEPIDVIVPEERTGPLNTNAWEGVELLSDNKLNFEIPVNNVGFDHQMNDQKDVVNHDVVIRENGHVRLTRVNNRRFKKITKPEDTSLRYNIVSRKEVLNILAKPSVEPLKPLTVELPKKNLFLAIEMVKPKSKPDADSDKVNNDVSVFNEIEYTNSLIQSRTRKPYVKRVEKGEIITLDKDLEKELALKQLREEFSSKVIKRSRRK